MSNVFVIGFRTKDGKVQPLAWSPLKLSVKMLRSSVHKFRNDDDYLEPYQSEWSRLYHTKKDATSSLPKY